MDAAASVVMEEVRVLSRPASLVPFVFITGEKKRL